MPQVVAKCLIPRVAKFSTRRIGFIGVSSIFFGRDTRARVSSALMRSRLSISVCAYVGTRAPRFATPWSPALHRGNNRQGFVYKIALVFRRVAFFTDARNISRVEPVRYEQYVESHESGDFGINISRSGRGRIWRGEKKS